MKKQKFQPYEEPIFKNPMIPSRAQNSSALSKKYRKSGVRNVRSVHKKPQQFLPKEELFDYHKNRQSSKQDTSTQQNRETFTHVILPKQIFFNNLFDQVNQHISLRKINPPPIDVDNILAKSQGKRILNNTSKFSSKKINTSVLIPRRDLKELKQLKIKNFTDSPYLKNVEDVSKIFRMLKPVKGPNQSIKKQIIQYNDLNKKNHELVVLRRPNQTFQVKRQVYLERIGLKPDSKVFIMNSKDQHIREALIKRNWIELQDISDSFFHLKWAYSDSSSDYSNLNRGQLFNHFYNNQQLTNKNNLRKNIKNASPKDRPTAPLTFDFGIAQEFKKFVENATLFEGIKILNLIKNTLEKHDRETYNRIQSNPNYFMWQTLSTQNSNSPKKKSTFQIQNLLDFSLKEVDDKDVEILIASSIDFIQFLVKQIEKETPIRYSCFNKDNPSKKGFSILSVLSYFQSLVNSQHCGEIIGKIPKFLKVQLIKLHFHFQKQDSFYKPSYGTENSWIVKPTGVSRGTGISIESDYKKLMSQTNNNHGKIVQKYIEKPFLLQDHRKFDLRQWVLVKSFEPLEVYIFSKLYGRICPQKYAQNDFQNIQKHLTNYSLSKQFYKTKNSSLSNISSSEQTCAIFNRVGMKRIHPASIILQHDLVDQISHSHSKTKPNKTWPQIQLQIKSNILNTLKSCSPNIEQNPNSFQMYGFDILLDEKLNVFVIEVNLSPACEKREGLEVYLEGMGDGLVDLMEGWLGLGGGTEKKRREGQFIWEKLDQEDVQRGLDEIRKEKLRDQKARLIQAFVRSKVLTSKNF